MNADKWTELEHLPEWDEEYYHVYTAKKHGKWVMLKTLRPEFKDDPEMRALIEREFDVRYNLAHPNIVMINDFEDVPTLGMSIITDDVYGDSLRKLIDTGKLTEAHVYKICHELVMAMEYIETNHLVHQPIRPERVLFTENVGNLKLIDVGFDQKQALKVDDIDSDLHQFGQVLTEALDAVGSHNQHLRRVARNCLADKPTRHYRSISDLRMALEGRRNSRALMWIIVFLAAMLVVLAWLSSKYAPIPAL